jgi:hypothetical protein
MREVSARTEKYEAKGYRISHSPVPCPSVHSAWLDSFVNSQSIKETFQEFPMLPLQAGAIHPGDIRSSLELCPALLSSVSLYVAKYNGISAQRKLEQSTVSKQPF